MTTRKLDLPDPVAPSKYTPMDLIQILAYFFNYQKSWPEADTKTNNWTERTQDTIKAIGYALPNRAIYSSMFGCYENAVNLASKYLNGQDISQSSLLETITEQDVWGTCTELVTVDFVVKVFIKYYKHFGEYPSTGPHTWNRNTLFRCRNHGLKLPPFRQCVPKLGSMTFLKDEAEKVRRSFNEDPCELVSIVEYEVLPPEADSLNTLLEANKSLQKDVERASEAIETLITKNKKLEEEKASLNQTLLLESSKNISDTKNNLAVQLLFSEKTLKVLEAYNQDKNINLVIRLLKETAEHLDLSL
jgi:hypothetical protein